MPGKQDLFGQLWKEYSFSDSRYMTSDPFVLCMETVTAVRAIPSLNHAMKANDPDFTDLLGSSLLHRRILDHPRTPSTPPTASTGFPGSNIWRYTILCYKHV